MVWDGGLRPPLEATVRTEVLPVCQQCFCFVDMDADQTDRPFSTIHDAGRAGLYRGGEPDPGRCPVQLYSRTRRTAQKVLVEDGHVTGVATPEGVVSADAVICTVPTPFVSAMVPDLPAD